MNNQVDTDGFDFDEAVEAITEPQDANDVVNHIMEGKTSMDKMQVIGKPILEDLIMALYKNKDKSSMANLSVVAISEHMFLMNLLTKNLLEATILLREKGIDFHSMVNPDAEPPKE